jgi:hypothetical protein
MRAFRAESWSGLAWAVLTWCTLCAQGCTAWQVNQLATALPQTGPEQTLLKLQEIVPSDRDSGQYLLDRGILKFYSGDLPGSRKDLEQAKEIMGALTAVSITENLAAITTNETLRSYVGTPTEQALVHAVLALGYLGDGDLDGARVEMLQADVTMKQLTDGDSVSGQLASVRFLAGLIYEINGELDDALISYRKAHDIIKSRGDPMPPALASSLLNVSLRQNNEEEYQNYVSEFGREALLPAANQGEWILVYSDGVVSSKTENRLSVFDSKLKTLITVVVPRYLPSRYQARHLSLQIAAAKQRTEVIESMESRVREDLDDQMPKILAAATLRAVAKYQMTQEASEQGEMAGLLANIAGVLSEQADVRSWNMLPASIQVLRMVAPLDAKGQLLEKGIALPAIKEVTSDKYMVLLANSLNDRLLSYPPYKGFSPEDEAVIQLPKTTPGEPYEGAPQAGESSPGESRQLPRPEGRGL